MPTAILKRFSPCRSYLWDRFRPTAEGLEEGVAGPRFLLYLTISLSRRWRSNPRNTSAPTHVMNKIIVIFKFTPSIKGTNRRKSRLVLVEWVEWNAKFRYNQLREGGGGVGELTREKVKFTNPVEITNMTDCISSL